MENVDEAPEVEQIDDELPDIDAPLELLTSVSSRLLNGEIPANSSRLQALFEHIQSVVGDIVEASFEKITYALDHLEEANEVIREEGEDSEEAEAFFTEFNEGREHIEEGLAIMQETFFSAKNMEDLEDFEDEFREAEVQLAEGLGRLETAVIRAENLELFQLDENASSIHVEDALEAFASGLDALNAHLEDGKASHLEWVLQSIDQAREHVQMALEDVNSRAAEEPEAEEQAEEEEAEEEEYEEFSGEGIV